MGFWFYTQPMSQRKLCLRETFNDAIVANILVFINMNYNKCNFMGYTDIAVNWCLSVLPRFREVA